MNPQVEQLPRSEWQRAGEVEGRAFQGTPLFRALFPDPASRAETSRVVTSLGIRMALATGKVVDTTASRKAFMVWDPPGYRDTPWMWLRRPSSLYQLMRHVPRADLQRLTDWEARWATRRHELLPEPHWYAEMLAVDPDAQGYGLGAVLTCHGLERAAATGTPTFLETDSARNAAFYAKMGFELIEQGHDDALDMPVWRMVHRATRPGPSKPRPHTSTAETQG